MMDTFWICFWLFLILAVLNRIDDRGAEIARELRRMNDSEERK